MNSGHSIEIATMSLSQKLALMEELWRDLSADSEAFRSPDWHKDILEERSSAVTDGTEEYEDWETAKAKLLRLGK
jgi:hypothetical protein